jgi:hypothetical protein
LLLAYLLRSPLVRSAATFHSQIGGTAALFPVPQVLYAVLLEVSAVLLVIRALTWPQAPGHRAAARAHLAASSA